MTSIRGEIDVNRAVMARWGWKSTGLSTGHMLVIKGYNTSTSQVQVINPDGGTTTWTALATFTDNASHKWTHSRYYIIG